MSDPTPLEHSVAELVTNLSMIGVGTRRNSSRAVSDSLRAEVARGRVRRVRRGRYAVRPSELTKRHVRYARLRVRMAVEADRASRVAA